MRYCVRPNRQGFTLIEVLIATAILSLAIYLASLSTSIFLNIWEDKQFTDTRAIEDFRSHLLLRFALESIYDYYVTDPFNEKNGKYYPYFKGGKDTIEFVTLSSVFNKKKAAAARLKLDEREIGSEDGLSLIYEEMPLDGTYIKYNDFKPEYKNTLIAYRDVKKIKLRYYGAWETIWLAEAGKFETVLKWQEVFSGKERKTIPETIELKVTTRDGETTLMFSIRAKNIYKKEFFQNAFR